MNPWNNDAERIITQRRLHGGIFILPVIALFVVILPEILLILMFQNFMHSFDKLVGTHESRSLFWPYAIMLAMGAAPAFFTLLVTWVAYMKSEITLTKERLIFRTGLISRTSGELPLENVESLYISESLLGRVLGYGTVTVTSIGGQTVPLQHIGAPQHFHSEIKEAIEAAKFNQRRPATRKPPEPPPADDSRYMPKR